MENGTAQNDNSIARRLRPSYVAIVVIGVIGLSAVAIWNRDDLTRREGAANSAEVSGRTESEIRKLQVAVPLNDLEETAGSISRPEKESEPAVDRTEPHLLYQKYLSLAENGDDDAAYVLVTALQQCLYVSKSEDELITEMVYQGKSQDVIEVARQSMSRCSALFEILPDVQKEHDRWYEAVQDAQHPIFLVEQRNQPYEEARQLVLSAFSNEYPERHMNYQVFLAASRLFVKYPEVGIDENRFYAWQLLACSAAIRCDHENLRKTISDEFSVPQSRDIFALEEQLNRSLESGKTDDLGI